MAREIVLKASVHVSPADVGLFFVGEIISEEAAAKSGLSADAGWVVEEINAWTRGDDRYAKITLYRFHK